MRRPRRRGPCQTRCSEATDRSLIGPVGRPGDGPSHLETRPRARDLVCASTLVLAKVRNMGYFVRMKIPTINVPSIHSIDLTKFDVKKFDVKKFDVKKLDVTKLDVSKLPLPNIDVAKIASAPGVQRAKDVGYTAVGFGVLAFQKAQVRRREIAESVASTVKQTLKDRFNTAK